MTSLSILSGGAAQGLVGRLAADFKARTGLDIEGEFGAVGTMAGKLRGGRPADLVVLTATLIADLARENLVASCSISDIGRVETAIAVRAGDPPVSIHDAASLREVLLAADAIFIPDTETSTAGIHVASMLRQLGIADRVAARLRVYPNGATAMRHLAGADAAVAIGCTQSTEIINTQGVKLSGFLPPGCELSTVYTAAITTSAAHGREAQILIDLLTNQEQGELRTQAGFLKARK